MSVGVFQRTAGRGALIALALVLAVIAGTVSAVRPGTVFASSLDTCGYNPSAAPSPNGGTVSFNENTVTRAIAFYGTGLGGHVGVFANDESGLYIGAGGTPSSSAGSSVGTAGSLPANTQVTSIPVPAGTSIGVSAGDQITVTSGNQHQNFNVTANAASGATSISVQPQNVGGQALTGGTISDPSIVWGQAVPPTFGSGSDAAGRPIAPTIYLTDITSNANSTGGDWENGGQAATTGASALYGSWTPTLGTKPVNKNDWTLGPNADPIPATDAFGGTTTSYDEGYGTEVAWNVSGLKAYDPTTGTLVAVQPGHTYRVQSMTHDGDQNKDSGDVGEVCTTFSVPSSQLTITKTADAASVNAGEQVGFTVEIKNTGNVAATSASLNDPLPAGSGTGVTWAIDTSSGTPASFVLSGSQGSQTLGLASSNIPVGADYKVHITAQTSATECGTYDNTATLTSSGSNPPPAHASEACKPANVTITKTADAASVNAGETVGFTVEVKNTGTGLAKGVSLSDGLPAGSGTGVTWAVDNGVGTPAQFVLSGAKGSQTLSLASNTLPAGADYTIHITAATSLSECSTYDNTATLTTTNAVNPPPASASETCLTPGIKVLKTADAAQVSAGDPIGFTVTVYNAGQGDAKNTTLSDPLPTNTGLNWVIQNQGTGWGGSCSISFGTLNCGGNNGVTVKGGTTEAASTFTVHITSTTTAATGGSCPNTGVVTNTGYVTTSNGGSDHSTASTCVASGAIQIVKTADAAQVNAGDPIGFTVTVFNTGTGDAKNVELSDPLPVAPGLNWQIASVGAGWGNSCSIAGGTLNCGGANGVTVPFGTTQFGSSFTVRITSTTTAATGGVCPGGSGVVTNTGYVFTSNAGTGNASASTCVASASVQIAKTADAPEVNAGEQVGFTVTVFNSGTGDAKGVTVSDPLPTNTGLAWTIEHQGGGWAGTCSIVGTTLSCGGVNGVTVPAGTTQGGSTFTVHIISGTTPDTGGVCPNTGVVTNIATVSSTNAGSQQAQASTCVQGETDLSITKSGSPATQTVTKLPGGNITWTITVTNNGPLVDTNVTVGDPVPANNILVQVTPLQGTCTGTAIIECKLGTLQVHQSVIIYVVTTPLQEGPQTNTAQVVGDLAETDYTNNQASATVQVIGKFRPPFCDAVLVTPKQLYAGRTAHLHFTVMMGHVRVKGVRIRITGGAGLKGVHLTTKPSNARGKVTQALKPKTRGILYFKPIVSPPAYPCTAKVGVASIVPPPVTG